MIQLSISLLASDKTSSLERCLDSLKRLMLNVPSELIVVLTTTDEKVREIAGRYTDKLVPFTWCDDFSAARNAGLKQAMGEWFLFIDDDEWFEDTTEICDFFLSGEYKQYTYAYYTVRNYTAWNGVNHSDVYVQRMAKRTPKLKFENPIHETLIYENGNGKYFDAYVHHYGYVKDVPGDTKKQSSRNIPLLLQDIEKHPDYVKNYLQLTKEYGIEEKWKEAEAICRKGIALCQQDKNGAYMRWLQVYLARILCNKPDKQQAICEMESILQLEKPCELVCLIIRLLLVAQYVGQEMMPQALECGIRFEETLEFMNHTPALWKEQEYGDITKEEVTNPSALYVGRLNCVVAALELEDYEKANYFLKLLPWEDEKLFGEYYPILDKWKRKYHPHFEEILIRLDFESDYLLLQRVLSFPKEDKIEKSKQLIRCMERIDNIYLQYQIVREACVSQTNLSVLLEKMDLPSWKSCAEQAMKQIAFAEIPQIRQSFRQIFGQYELQKLWLEKLIYEKELTRGYLMGEEFRHTFKDYCLCIIEFYKNQFSDTMLVEEKRTLLPKDCQFAMTGLEALDMMTDENGLEVVRLLKTAIQLYPQMSGVIRELIRQMMDKMNNVSSDAGAEFQQLAAQMKAAVSAMIENQQYAEAKSIVKQLTPLLPDDLELLKLQHKIWNKEN